MRQATESGEPETEDEDFVDGKRVDEDINIEAKVVECGPIECFCGFILVEENEQISKNFSMQVAAHCSTECPIFIERKAQAQRLELDRQP